MMLFTAFAGVALCGFLLGWVGQQRFRPNSGPTCDMRPDESPDIIDAVAYMAKRRLTDLANSENVA